MYLVLDLRRALYDVAKDNFGVVMPGYTHMQKAQPILQPTCDDTHSVARSPSGI